MGEVYRALDTRLEATVAIKILPPHLSGDRILRQRFEREAKAVSSLNHPHEGGPVGSVKFANGAPSYSPRRLYL